jgi:hypothetical protein
MGAALAVGRDSSALTHLRDRVLKWPEQGRSLRRKSTVSRERNLQYR